LTGRLPRPIQSRIAQPPDAPRWRVSTNPLTGERHGHTNTASSVISSETVSGTNVYNPAGDKLGTIDTLMIDKLSGKVRYAVMEFGGFLGIGTDRYPLPWESLKYEPNMNGYVVSLTREQLDNAPRYERDTAPAYTDEYGRRVNDYYGVPYL